MKEKIIKFLIKITPTPLKKIRKKIIRQLENIRFEYRNDSIPGEMLRGELNWLFKTAKNMNSIVEVGSWKGRSTHALLSGCQGIVYAVDHFKGSKTGQGNCTPEKAAQEDIFQEFLKNVGHFQNLKVYKMDSLEAAKKFKNKSVDMVFIDGDHSFESVKADIEAWLPKARKLICGHDYNESSPGVKQAVKGKFGYVRTVYNIWFHYL